MNLQQALDYLVKNYKELFECEASIIGVAHTPEEEAEVFVVCLSLDDDAKENDVNHFNINFEGGDFKYGSDGVEGYIFGENLDQILESAPEFVKNIQYKVYYDIELFGLETVDSLKNLYPELPDPEEFDLEQFKAQALELIASSNKI